MATVVKYDGTNYGRLYLNDIGRRNQLGGGVSVYGKGQDQYLSSGQDATLVSTSDVLLSVDRGRIKKFVDKGALTVS